MIKSNLFFFFVLTARLSGSDIGLFQNSGSASANLVLNPGPSQQVVTAVATGYYDNFGNGTGTYAGPQYDPSYFTGSLYGTEFRSYFIFDLSSFSSGFMLTDALLQLENPVNSAFGVPFTLSINPLEFTGYDVSDLASGNGGIAAFADLGDGTPYGSVFLTNASALSVTVTLNAAALNNVRAVFGQGYAPFGGSLLPYQASTVPEPGTWCITLTSLVCLMVPARRVFNRLKGVSLD